MVTIRERTVLQPPTSAEVYTACIESLRRNNKADFRPLRLVLDSVHDPDETDPPSEVDFRTRQIGFFPDHQEVIISGDDTNPDHYTLTMNLDPNSLEPAVAQIVSNK